MEKKGEEIFRRVGHRSIYSTLLDKGYFSRGDESPIVSVKKAPYEQAIRLISINNALKN